jgi:uncharacterized membrane protein
MIYKKYISFPHYIQGILYLGILLLGVFSTRYYSWNGTLYESNFYEVLSVFLVIITISQIFTFSFMYTPLSQLKNDKLNKLKLFAGMTAFGYAVLSSFYIHVLSVRLYYWVWGSYTSTNLAGTLLVAFWYIATIISVGLFLINLILFFIFPSSKNAKQILKIKSKASKLAADNIRELKKLLDEGIISKEIFDEKSKKYIEEL